MPHTPQPYHLRQHQQWAVDQERLRHNQAIYSVGEWTMFTLMWHLEDFLAELVARCSTCYVAKGRIAEAYGQASNAKCDSCYGTTFEGGIKAQIVRPAIFTDTDEDERLDKRGVVHPDDVSIETTTDFRVRTGDYAFRADGTRWQLRVPERVTLRTGFNMPTQLGDAIGYNNARANQEEPGTVVFEIPPSPTEVAAILSVVSFHPVDFSEFETINAPLIPPVVSPRLTPET